MHPIDVVWDMETDDPDDFLTLLLLAGHPQINLKAVTVLPGSPQQIGLVRYALHTWFDLEIPIGAHNLGTMKPSVSAWHYQAYGEMASSMEAEPAADVLLRCCDADTTLIMGAPLTNLASALKHARKVDQPLQVKRIIIQGGFAGVGVVPDSLQLPKFRGLRVCPTHNLIVDSKAALTVLAFTGTQSKYFVSKNVCHRVTYDPFMHERIASVKETRQFLSLIWQGMDVYLRDHPDGKLLHDPLAACCAVDPAIGTWAEVELYREGNAWGATLAPASNMWIIIDYDPDKFFRILTAT